MKDRSLLIENDKKILCYNFDFISLGERPHIWANFFLFYNNTPGIIHSQVGMGRARQISAQVLQNPIIGL